jgi:hypothetical protein
MPISEGTLLPPIPTKLSQIDETTVSQHFLLAPTDVCYHIWEYTRRGGFTASPTNNLISNLKKKPSKIQTNPREAPWKEQAIGYCGQALQRMMNRPWIEGIGTLVPIPCSKIAGHPDHDDRLVRILQKGFHGFAADIRPLLSQTCSTTADHETSERQRFEELLDVTCIDEAIVGAGVRPQIMVFDDVLNSGKHFKVAQRLLAQRFPGTPIIGVFLARCLPDPPVEFDPLPDMDL